MNNVMDNVTVDQLVCVDLDADLVDRRRSLRIELDGACDLLIPDCLVPEDR